MPPIALLLAALTAPPADLPRDRWEFKLKDFVIGAWWGPGPTDAEVKLYRECGFNVVMTGRYMEPDGYGDPDRVAQELDLAGRHGLGALIDTYTLNDKPWGGKAGPYEPHPTHHPSSLVELQWLHERFGRHPALVGYMVGDDQGSVGARSDACTRFLFEQPKPHLFPWLCGWIGADNLAQHNNPIADPQLYPTLYSWGSPAEDLARQYTDTFHAWSQQCRRHGILFWPMINVAGPNGGALPSDSLVRFPAYAAIAYGAEGLWYFTYNGGAIEKPGRHETEEQARAALTPLYPVVQRINTRLAGWGPRLLGRQCAGVYATAFGAKLASWPFAESVPSLAAAAGLAAPAAGRLVEALDADLLVGILTRAGEAPLAMVVDCRVSKAWGDLPAREVAVRFAPAVREVAEPGGGTTAGAAPRLTLEAGEGRLLELRGEGLETLAAAESAARESEPQPVTDAELRGIRAAKLRVDVFGSNAEPEFRAKWIELNGQRVGQVPAGRGDAWALTAVDLAPEQLARVQRTNELTVRTECADAWKFAHLTLAVQLADGRWVRSESDPQVHSSPGWAHTEGEAWGPDGVAGPVRVTFR
ncbi:MAG: hypothetical protein HYU66_16005 [Armatimonadetes bacterium]|nr:hypothetical protein [Armatimonadota bacterium]